jgi:ribosome-associated translation inhibitor RaiA
MRHAGQTVIENVQVSLTSKVPDDARGYAVAKIAALAKYAPAQVDDAAVRLTTTAGRRTRPRFVAHARLTVNGTGVNADAEAATYTEAIDLLHDRVRDQLLKLHN